LEVKVEGAQEEVKEEINILIKMEKKSP